MTPKVSGAPLAAKWDSYYAAGGLTAPFDSTRPSSQLVDYICSCLQGRVISSKRPHDADALADVARQAVLCLPPEHAAQRQLHACPLCQPYKPQRGGSVLELGCGTGASARWLACQGFQVTAVDVSAVALQAATAASAAEGLPAGNPRWLLQDIFSLEQSPEHHGTSQRGVDVPLSTDLSASAPEVSRVGEDGSAMQLATTTCHPDAAMAQYDFIHDCQVYHVLVRDQAEHKDRLPQLLFDLLRPGGLLMILAGNANEPEVGPNVLTAEQLLQPLLSVGFELVLLHQTRFDSTEHYLNVLGMRPLAWWVVLQRPR